MQLDLRKGGHRKVRKGGGATKRKEERGKVCVSPQSDRQEVDQQEGVKPPSGLLGHRWLCSWTGGRSGRGAGALAVKAGSPRLPLRDTETQGNDS